MNVTIVHNPAAGAYDLGAYLPWVAERLEERGARTQVVCTERPGQIGELGSRVVAEGGDVLFLSGGDGSLGEAAASLAGSPVALGVLPAGTGNVWAKQLGLPVVPLLPGFDPRVIWLHAATAQLDGEVRRVDVGQVGARRFLLWAGIGLDAFITHNVEPRPRAQKRFGMLSYAIAAGMVAGQFRGMRARVQVDGRRLKGRMLLIVVSNTQLYLGGLARIDPHARVDDGLFDVWVFYGLGLGWTVRQIAGLMVGQHLRDPHVRHMRGRRIVVRADPAAALHLDAEPSGMTPIEITVLPRSLAVLVPPSAPSSLFV